MLNATLERLDVLPRWSVGARRSKRYLSEFMRQSTNVEYMERRGYDRDGAITTT